jgi:hypothetical protein
MKKMFKKILESKLEQRKKYKVVKVNLDNIEILDYSMGSELFVKVEEIIDNNSDEFTDFEITQIYENGQTVMFIIFKP